MVASTSSTTAAQITALNAEIARFREELTLRDRLVRQLSQELFRIVKNPANKQSRADCLTDTTIEVRQLREQLQGVEQQVRFYQEQLHHRDIEIIQLRRTVRELTERSQMLEQIVRELPRLYVQKFAQRLEPLKEKITSLKEENQRLTAELQSVTLRLERRVNDDDGDSIDFGAVFPAFGS
jgi:chromosome segregation ATPase